LPLEPFLGRVGACNRFSSVRPAATPPFPRERASFSPFPFIELLPGSPFVAAAYPRRRFSTDDQPEFADLADRLSPVVSPFSGFFCGFGRTFVEVLSS